METTPKKSKKMLLLLAILAIVLVVWYFKSNKAPSETIPAVQGATAQTEIGKSNESTATTLSTESAKTEKVN